MSAHDSVSCLDQEDMMEQSAPKRPRNLIISKEEICCSFPDAGEGTSDLPSTPLLSPEQPAGQATTSTTSSPPAAPSEAQPAAGQEPRVQEPDTSSNTWTTVLFSLCIGLVSTFFGGMLTGKMVVVTAQILKTVGEDGPLMEALWTKPSNDTRAGLGAIYLSAAVANYSLIWSFFLLVCGVWAGKGTYSIIIQTEGESKRATALGVAGSVCLMLICELLAALGFTLKEWLLFSAEIRAIANVDFVCIGACFYIIISSIFIIFFMKISKINLAFVLVIFIVIIVLIVMFCNRLLLLTSPLFVISILVAIFGKEYGFYLNASPVPVMLAMGEVMSLCSIHVLNQQTLASITTTEVLEGLFFGFWNNQLFTMSVAMSVFASWQTGGANKFCAGASALGLALLGIIEGLIPALPPWPLLGALMGVAGAAGLALSAGGTAAGRYGQAGTVGAVLGAGVGAFLGSLSHGGVSSTFIALSTALIPAFNHPTFLFLLKDVFVTDSDQSESQATDNIPTAPDNPREESAPPKLKKKKRFYNG